MNVTHKSVGSRTTSMSLSGGDEKEVCTDRNKNNKTYWQNKTVYLFACSGPGAVYARAQASGHSVESGLCCAFSFPARCLCPFAGPTVPTEFSLFFFFWVLALTLVQAQVLLLGRRQSLEDICTLAVATEYREREGTES